MIPFLALGGTGLLLLISDILRLRKMASTIILLTGLCLTIAVCIWQYGSQELVFGMAKLDNSAFGFCLTSCVITLLWYLLFQRYFDNKMGRTDMLALIVFALIGGLCMVSFTNLTLLFLGIEILSISLYVLAGSEKDNLHSTEAAFKYFLMGAFTSGFLLMGLALVYGATGSFDIYKIAESISLEQGNNNPLIQVGILMIIVGMGFKVSGAPFHFWAPDVYQGSPTVITAFMASVVKLIAVAAFFRLFLTAFPLYYDQWSYLVWGMSALTLLVGNIMATVQENVKRMLAYSSVGHAGFLLVTLASNQPSANLVILYYAAAYSLATILSFGIVYFIHRDGQTEESLSSFNGLGRRSPLLATLMTISLLSLAGIPPLSGFIAKYFVIATALRSGLIGLVVISILASIIGVYYYFRIIRAMYAEHATTTKVIEVSKMELFILWVLVGGMVLLGVYPGLLL
jgi:NADH-quinone oxidoreductase subunit N